MLEDFRLKVFTTVAEEGSFTRAARRLGISQPAVSQNVAELEKQLGSPLFERGRGEVSLTPEGLAFKRYAERIMFLYGAAAERFSAHPGIISGGVVKMAADDFCSTCLLMPLAREYWGARFIIETYPSSFFADGAPAAKADALLYAAFPSGTLAFGDSSLPVGSVSPALCRISQEDGRSGAGAERSLLAVWEPYLGHIPENLKPLVVFSSSSVHLLSGYAEKHPRVALIVPRQSVPAGFFTEECHFPSLEMEVRIVRSSSRLGPDAFDALRRRLTEML